MLMTRFPDSLAYGRTNAPPCPVNLALSGSGSHGAFGWGILDKLLEDGRFAVEGVAASGTDSLNAATLAFGRMRGREGARELLEALWREVGRGGALGEHVASEEGRRAFHHGWANAAGFLASFIDFGELRRGRDTNLVLQAANARTGQARLFTNRQITVEVLLGCSRLPQSIPPVRLGEEVYWDGRYCGLPAMEQLMLLAASPELLVGKVSATGGRMASQTLAEVDVCSAERALSQLSERDILAFPLAFANAQRDWAGQGDRDEFEVSIHQIRSTDVMSDLTPSSRFDIRWATIVKLRDMGRLAAEIWLQGVPWGIRDVSIENHRASAREQPC